MLPESPHIKTFPSPVTAPLWDSPHAMNFISFSGKSITLKAVSESRVPWPRAKVLPFPQLKTRPRLVRIIVWIAPQATWTIFSLSRFLSFKSWDDWLKRDLLAPFPRSWVLLGTKVYPSVCLFCVSMKSFSWIRWVWLPISWSLVFYFNCIWRVYWRESENRLSYDTPNILYETSPETIEVTRVGSLLFSRSPRPSWPLKLRPHAYSSPVSAEIPKECSAPQAID